MDFSVGISEFSTNYGNLNAIGDYNKFLQGNASFEIDITSGALVYTTFDDPETEKKTPARRKGCDSSRYGVR